MTERTYKKDLEIIADNFRRELMNIVNQQQEWNRMAHLEAVKLAL